jgi:hypothetical protein
MTLNLLSVTDFSVKMVNTLNSSLGIWYLVILNAFGVMAMISKLFEYQVKGRSLMLVVAIIANICWVLYFFFYGDLMSSLTCGINVIRMILFAQREKYKWAKSNLWLYFFLAVQTVVAIFTFKGWFDIFVLIAGYSAVFAYFVINQKTYRLISLLYIIMWVINDAIKFFPVSLISDSISTVSIIIAIFRYDILTKQGKIVKKSIEENPVEDLPVEQISESK